MTTWRQQLETAVGGVQLRAMQRAAAFAAGLRNRRTDHGIAYYHRPGNRRLTPLACIHGFGGDKETWLLMSALVPRGRGAALIDLPGHGASVDVPESAATIRHHAEAVIRVLDQAGIDRAIVCGNSMGGGVALRLAATFPDRVAGLVLVASIGRDIHDGPARGWIDGADHGLASSANNDGLASSANNPLIPGEADVEKFMQIVLERPPPVPKAVIRHVIMQRVKAAPRLRKLFRGFVLAGDDRDGVPRDVRRIDQQALVIHGEQDRIISKRVGEDLVQALPRGELIVMRGVGHAPQLEAPRATGRIIEAFARRVDRD